MTHSRLEGVVRAFVDSKLTPLLIASALLLGLFAILQLPREEEPQIIVPMMDLFVELPGASSKEVEDQITIPLEKRLAKIPGVEHIYSTSMPGRAMATVVFYVGENLEAATVNLYRELYAHLDLLPPGARPPVVKPREIDDVPIVALTLWSETYDHYTLRRIAAELADALQDIPDVADITLIGGPRRQLRVLLEPDRMAAAQVEASTILSALQRANQELPIGSFTHNNTEYRVNVGGFFQNVTDIQRLVVGAHAGRPVYLEDVANIEDGPEELQNYVLFADGPAAHEPTADTTLHPAVILSIAKQKGANAVTVAEQIQAKVTALRSALLPNDVRLTVTRNYGESAQDKFNELLEHLLIAVVAVTALMALFLSWRAALVIFIAVPATLALTLCIYYALGYTLNRMTFFGLIISIGILVDDPIVGVENIVRHAHLPENRGRDLLFTITTAVAEVGSPLILASLAVIFAFIPLVFVDGLAGSYARPMPVGATASMVFSMVVAFVMTPWAAYRFLQRDPHLTTPAATPDHDAEGWTMQLYRRGMRKLLLDPWKRRAFLGGLVVLLLGALGLLWSKIVVFKLLPYDNKAEFKVMIDLPEGAPLEHTAQVSRAIGEYLSGLPEVTNYQLCIGTASPYDFNGLVRRYFLRHGPNVADIHVNVLNKHARTVQLHDLVKRIRPDIHAIAESYGALITLAESPPGPPVRQTLVAEVYGPDYETQIALADKIHTLFQQTPGVVDIDWSVEAPQPLRRIVVDKEKAALHGISTERVVQTVQVAVSGTVAGFFHLADEKEPVPLFVHLPRAERSTITDLTNLQLVSATGRMTPLAELVTVDTTTEPPFIYRKDQKRVVYVVGDTAGAEDSPLYTIFQLNSAMQELQSDTGAAVPIYLTHPPFLTEGVSIKWDGEWQVTWEFLRNVLLAFVAVLILIYMLLVGWFQSFKTPLIILTPVPLSLIGILPAHALCGIFFSGTSIIGFIAGAGIVARNSIILVDFAELRRRQGMSVLDAVVDAGAIRFRPMLLTAASVVVGSAVMLFDPIFQGLALALMAGEVASTLLSRLAVPVLYYLSEHRHDSVAPKDRSSHGEWPDVTVISASPLSGDFDEIHEQS